eukprot:TRINITY_DN11334_c0_g1_i1.p1 TRINITY_DN11334_c0_g1~~TRINITY_DN11334_c0_g1_i1.p1  ORF type:complete len:133 (-),score=16.92 TRINITY_DN11334_c0_g1_i1:2-400(-)
MCMCVSWALRRRRLVAWPKHPKGRLRSAGCRHCIQMLSLCPRHSEGACQVQVASTATNSFQQAQGTRRLPARCTGTKGFQYGQGIRSAALPPNAFGIARRALQECMRATLQPDAFGMAKEFEASVCRSTALP